LLRLLDKAAFKDVAGKITYYTLNLAIRKWSTTKSIANDFESVEELDFEPKTECLKGCELPTRYSLPCKHWLFLVLAKKVSIPLSLFHLGGS
jgi:hypothetical protein